MQLKRRMEIAFSSAREIEELQRKKLCAHIDHCKKNSPYYKDALAGFDTRSHESIAEILAEEPGALADATPDWRRVLETAMQNRPAYLSVLHRLEEQRIRYNVARNERLPSLELSGSAGVAAMTFCVPTTPETRTVFGLAPETGVSSPLTMTVVKPLSDATSSEADGAPELAVSVSPPT